MQMNTTTTSHRKPRRAPRVFVFGLMLSATLLPASVFSRIVVGQTPGTAAPLPAELTVPAGFKASVFASDLQGARLMAVSPEGVLLVARRPRNEVVALPDANRDGRAEPAVILSNLTNAHSL